MDVDEAGDVLARWAFGHPALAWPPLLRIFRDRPLPQLRCASATDGAVRFFSVWICVIHSNASSCVSKSPSSSYFPSPLRKRIVYERGHRAGLAQPPPLKNQPHTAGELSSRVAKPLGAGTRLPRPGPRRSGHRISSPVCLRAQR